MAFVIARNGCLEIFDNGCSMDEHGEPYSPDEGVPVDAGMLADAVRRLETRIFNLENSGSAFIIHQGRREINNA